MSAAPDRLNLLDEILAEGEPSDLREAVLAGTLREVKRRRTRQRVRHSAAVLAAGLVLGAFVWMAVRPTTIESLPPPAYALVETQPLSVDRIVHTGGLGMDLRGLSPGSVVLIRTVPGGYRTIDDAQLLRLLAPRPAILVGIGPNLELLVLASDSGGTIKPLN
jgi:hypothetical protein